MDEEAVKKNSPLPKTVFVSCADSDPEWLIVERTALAHAGQAFGTVTARQVGEYKLVRTVTVTTKVEVSEGVPA